MSGGDWKDLYQATLAGDLPRVQYHIQQGVDPNYQHPEIMCTPLVASLIHGQPQIAQYLLTHGADPNLLSEYDSLTPLQAAQQFGHSAIAQQLKELSAYSTQPSSSGLSRWWRNCLPL
jgi:uncharacterized protein